MVADRYTVHARTLVFLLDGNDVLLVRRPQRAHLFAGFYNGVGGHIERGEDVLSSAMREVREETGLEMARLSLRGVYSIARSQYRDSGEAEGEPGALVFIFVGHTDERQVQASDEGELVWVALEQLHEVDLVPDLHELLPRLLSRTDEEGPLFLAA